jgi:hypothetical protein
MAGDEMRRIEKPEVGEYKGSPTISIPVGNGGRPFTFGYRKAKAVLTYLEEIRSFVASVEAQTEVRTDDRR